MKKEKQKLAKENFIDFLAHATPEDINQLILEKGKPKKPYTPVFFFNNENQK